MTEETREACNAPMDAVTDEGFVVESVGSPPLREVNPAVIVSIIEAALMVADRPLSLTDLCRLMPEDMAWQDQDVMAGITYLTEQCQDATRGIVLVSVSSGYRFQVKPDVAPALHKLWEKKPAKYTRAFLETLALIAYQQPISRGEIEAVRGVAVRSNIIRTLEQREWIKVVGTKDVPGKPALFGTTAQFLDDFGLTALTDLPPLADVTDLEALERAVTEQLSLTPADDDGHAVDWGPIDHGALDAAVAAADDAIVRADEKTRAVLEAQQAAAAEGVDESKDEDIDE